MTTSFASSSSSSSSASSTQWNCLHCSNCRNRCCDCCCQSTATIATTATPTTPATTSALATSTASKSLSISLSLSHSTISKVQLGQNKRRRKYRKYDGNGNAAANSNNNNNNNNNNCNDQFHLGHCCVRKIRKHPTRIHDIIKAAVIVFFLDCLTCYNPFNFNFNQQQQQQQQQLGNYNKCQYCVHGFAAWLKCYIDLEDPDEVIMNYNIVPYDDNNDPIQKQVELEFQLMGLSDGNNNSNNNNNNNNNNLNNNNVDNTIWYPSTEFMYPSDTVSTVLVRMKVPDQYNNMDIQYVIEIISYTTHDGTVIDVDSSDGEKNVHTNNNNENSIHNNNNNPKFIRPSMCGGIRSHMNKYSDPVVLQVDGTTISTITIRAAWARGHEPVKITSKHTILVAQHDRHRHRDRDSSGSSSSSSSKADEGHVHHPQQQSTTEL